MKKFITYFLFLMSYIGLGQGFDFQLLCITCAESGGFFCGDDPSNWTQYSPDGCVQADWINDGWEDCVDAADENTEGPTEAINCLPPIPVGCDTVYLTEYETLFDTIFDTEYIYEIVVDTVEVEVSVPQYIYITDTVYAEVLDTLFVDVIEEVEVVVYDTIVETEYVEFIIEEFIDCETGLPCNSSLLEVIEKSKNSDLMYNIYGQPVEKPKGLFIENGKVKWHK